MVLQSLKILTLIIFSNSVSIAGVDLNSNDDSDYFSNRVNLALRKTIDQMLIIAGDSSTRVEPVKNEKQFEFSIRVEKKLNYDSLPDILEKAFASYQIDKNYFVSIENCDDGELILGYTRNDLESGRVPCRGREEMNSCYVVNIVFHPESDEAGSPWLYSIAMLAMVLVGLIVYQRSRSESLQTEKKEVTASGVSFGNSTFDPSNQILYVLGKEKSLTFRESKLLNYFLEHQNQLLERDQILSAVWEDEGIMVGRSLDVFISRLRKLLKQDDQIRIANVHGVGYRFEVV